MKWKSLLCALMIAALMLPFAAQADELPVKAAGPSAEAEGAAAPDGDGTVPEETPEADAAIAPEPVDEEVAEIAEEEAVIAPEPVDEEVAEAEAELAGDQAAFEAEAVLFGSEPDGIAIDETNFPDPVFRKYVSDKLDKSNPKDNVLDQDEIDAVNGFEVIVVEGMGIKSLKGIEFFPNLQLLRCSDNQLTTLDVSKNTNLITLFCEDNKLTSLNVSANPHLDWIHCSGNQLTELDITHCSGYLLKYVNASRFARKDSVVSYTDDHPKDPSEVLICDASTKIIGGSPVDTWSPPAPAFDPAPAPASDPAPAPTSDTASASVQTVSATKKSTKRSVTAAPGSAIQLNLNGKQGRKFKSSNRKVATVDANGLVTVKKGGRVRITMKVGRKKRTVTLVIKDPTVPASVTLTAPATAVKKGDSVTLAPVVPENTNPGGFKWKSSNRKVATVSKDGVVTFKKKGRVTITCTAKRGKKKAKVKFKVGK